MALEWEIDVRLESDTPVVGVELNPWVRVKVRGSYLSPPKYAVKFTWYREHHHSRNSEKAWIEISSTRAYVPLEDDINSNLLLESVAIDDKGIQKSTVNKFFTSSVIRSPSPVSRPMLIFYPLERLLLNPNQITAKPFKDGSFRVLSYNILADLYAKRDAYTHHCPSWALTWEYRRRNLMIEMLAYDADILCLQEVQSDHFKNFFEPEFAKFGYSAIYKKKTKEVYNGDQYIIDGCATFFKNDKFNMVVKYEVEYGNMALSLIEKLEADRRDKGIFRLMKDNIALVAILEVKENHCHPQPRDAVAGSRICVANTHIYRGGLDASDVRLFQVVNLIRGLEKIEASGFPVLLCGDMNSVPGSDPHRFLVTGQVEYFDQKHSGDPLGVYKNLKLSHSMHLASAYSSFDSGEVEQQILRPRKGFQTMETKSSSPRTLDYILYSEDRFKVDGLLKLLDCNDSMGKRSLPSPQWSSDHVALMANFRIRRAFRGRRYLSPPCDPWGQKQAQLQIPYMGEKRKTENSRVVMASAC